LLFQVFAGTEVLDAYFAQILDLVVARMTMSPMADHLKRHILCVFLTAFAYNPTYTINYCESKNLTTDLFDQIFTLAPSFTNIYERKIFIIGLSNALNAQTLP